MTDKFHHLCFLVLIVGSSCLSHNSSLQNEALISESMHLHCHWSYFSTALTYEIRNIMYYEADMVMPSLDFSKV